MMLFLIGLELEPKALWDMRHRLLGLGGLQVVVTMVLVAAAGVLLGYSWQQSLTAGTILALSSTAIVLQTPERKAADANPGRPLGLCGAADPGHRGDPDAGAAAACWPSPRWCARRRPPTEGASAGAGRDVARSKACRAGA